MKNLKFILPIIGITSGFSAYANLISNAKAAELSLHRVERLVILKKLRKVFSPDLGAFPLSFYPTIMKPNRYSRPLLLNILRPMAPRKV